MTDIVDRLRQLNLAAADDGAAEIERLRASEEFSSAHLAIVKNENNELREALSEALSSK